LIQAVAALRSEVAAHTNTGKLPLLRRAELAAAKAVAPARAVNRVLSNASWVDSSSSNSVPPAAGRGKGKKASAAAAAAAAAAGDDAAGGSNGGSSSSSSGIRLAPGASEAYDAAVAEQQHLQDSFIAELQAQLQWYGSFGSSAGGGWGRQQQRQQAAGGGLRVQEAFVVSEAEGLIGLVSAQLGCSCCCCCYQLYTSWACMQQCVHAANSCLWHPVMLPIQTMLCANGAAGGTDASTSSRILWPTWQQQQQGCSRRS
jgi:hypothetical protein